MDKITEWVTTMKESMNGKMNPLRAEDNINMARIRGEWPTTVKREMAVEETQEKPGTAMVEVPVVNLDKAGLQTAEIPKNADTSAVQKMLADLKLYDTQTQASPFDFVLLFNGGAGFMDKSEGGEQQKLVDAFCSQLKEVVQEGKRPVMVTGGTDSGIIQIAGKVREQLLKEKIDVALVGISPSAQVWKGEKDKKPADMEVIEPNHTHSVLVEGDNFGDETEVFFKVAEALQQKSRGEKARSMAAVYNGGGITVEEVERNFIQNRDMVVIGESGRTAWLLEFLQKYPTLKEFRTQAGVKLGEEILKAEREKSEKKAKLSTQTLTLVPKFIDGILNKVDGESDEDLEPRYRALHEKSQKLVKIITHDELQAVLHDELKQTQSV